jgi:fumarylpyruvate hydrolase
MESVIPVWQQPSLPVEGESARFPVRRIFCVGRNYAAHSREMGHDPEREEPFFFIKPADSLAQDGATIAYPSLTQDLQHEIELIAAIGRGGADIPPESALQHVYGYAVGLDLTRRDLQGEAKQHGRPWEVGKTFEGSAPCSAIQPASRIGHPTSGTIGLSVNGERRQEGDLRDLIWPLPDIIAKLSRLFPLKHGDLIMTGTPSGVGPLRPGDRLLGEVEGVGRLEITIGEPS